MSDSETQNTPKDAPVHVDAPKAATAAGLRSKLSQVLAAPWMPYAFAATVLSAAALGVMHNAGVRLLPTAHEFVVFDPVRFMNSQRAAASMLIGRNDVDMSLALTQVAKHAEAVISLKADGAIVLVKQTVVGESGLRDITSEVIEYFGLDPNAPSVAGFNGNDIGAIAPTDMAFSREHAEEDYRMELQEKENQRAAKAEAIGRQESMLP